MTLREVNLAMLGITLSLFVAMASNLVVLTAMPRIIADLGADQAGYSWIVTSSMLAITICTPIWGRISDRFDKKRLIQACVAGYVFSSICAGLAPAAWVIILCRIGIGICAAGIIVLMQAIAFAIATPLHRAKWVGYRGAVMAIATIGAPLIGGIITDGLGWRWCFFIGIPLAIIAIAVVHKTLHLPRRQTEISYGIRQVDWLGAALLGAAIVQLMLWVSVFGPDRGWTAPGSWAILMTGASTLAWAIRHEMHADLPVLPIELLARRDILLCTIAATGVGFSLFGSAVFLAIYLQLGRGLSPQAAGLLIMVEAVGTLLGSLISSGLISRRGFYRIPMLCGAGLLSLAYMFLGGIDALTPLLHVGIAVFLVGLGLGAVSENLVLVVQTVVPPDKAGAAGALINFFRMLGGIFCVAAMGALLSEYTRHRIRAAGGGDLISRSVPDFTLLDAPMRHIVETAYADGVALIYLACLPTALIVFASLMLMRRRRLDAGDAMPTLAS